MGLFDNAPSYDEIKAQGSATGNGNGKLKYLHQGVFPMTFVEAEIFEASNGNVALVMKYDSGFQTKNGDPNVLYKHYYLMDKSTLQHELKDKQEAPQRLIDEQSFLKVREMLMLLFDLPIEKVSSIKEAWETRKLKGMANQINIQLGARPEDQRTVSGTVEYENRPNKEGKYFLSLEWVNPIGELEKWQKTFKPKDNPNPPADRQDQQQSAPAYSEHPANNYTPGFDDEPPF